MSDSQQDLLNAFETHAVDEIRTLLDSGLDVNAPIKSLSPINSLIEMYARSDRFPDCLRLLLDRGAKLDDPVVESVLLNDAVRLDAELKQKPRLIRHRTNMVCCFTPLIGATLLHVAAEHGHLEVARVLLEHGANVNARAAKDAHGLNGHTPLFHTVNSNRNRSRPVMDLLLDAGAKIDLRVDGITWGHGFEWETVFFDVTPISYAQLGLLPQVHRNELEITDNVKRLLAVSGRAVPPLSNVPNKYLVRR